MASIFSENKDALLDFIDDSKKENLKFPLPKIGSFVNNYIGGDFIIVGGRKTSGKGAFILKNYVISPLIQKLLTAKSADKTFDTKVIYISTKKNIKNTMEKMIVNYISQRKGGHKVGVPSLYGYAGNHKKLSAPKAKKLAGQALDIFDSFVDKGVLNVSCGRKSIYEVEKLIRSAMDELGEYDEEESEYAYFEGKENTKVIVAIDDVTGIFSSSGSDNISNKDNAALIASKLKLLAKQYNVTLVLSVPSKILYSKASGHRCTSEEVDPYQMYADRIIIMHNPLETNEIVMVGYNVEAFMNAKTGASYLRLAYIAANYMGPSGVYIGLFMYPETGDMYELPRADDEDALDVFLDKVNK